MNKVTILLSFIILLALGGSVCAQNDAQNQADTVSSLPGIEIETSVDRAEVFIGDLIRYEVAIRYDSSKYTLVPPPLGANLGAFDVKDYQPDQVKELDDDRIESRTLFVLSTFTTGDYTIPPLPVIFELPDESRKLLLAEPVPIKVQSLLTNAGDSVDIRPLKEQYAFPRDYTQYYTYGGLGVILLLVAVVLWLLLRRKKREAELVDRRPPWEIAFEKLAFLQHEDLAGKEEYKEYYLRLTELARWYLERMYHVEVLEMTTEQFVESFEKRELPNGLYDNLISFFRHADMVKFARFTPERARTEGDFTLVHELIETVRADFERRQQQEMQLTKGRHKQPETEEVAT